MAAPTTQRTRRRRPTRVDHLTTALRKSQEVAAELTAVDMRTLRGDLRDKVRDARESNDAATKALSRAIRLDTPSLPLTG